ncbi:MAG: CRISPR-associated endonuclease Cas2 [Candidatus Moranbacteria bacterium]|jgi:DNA-binding transcriptional regulator PaaX|nr:CRISPR-associated endonuclease Cas2 [Candidatus Moranbacteria bacterium]MBP9801397.1 CRISPR-associated endonuclease Cas2 [Candidatus Moranbacteria bacterium]
MYKLGPVQQKVLLVLAGVVILGTETSSLRYYQKLRMLYRGWKKIDQRNFNRSVHRLSEQKLVQEVSLADGSFRLVLTKEGARQAKIQALFGSKIHFKRPKQWDKKWRIVLFDIPEKERGFRTVLREHLQELHFFKLQQSVFVSPFPCEKPIMELVALYGAEVHVRIMTAHWIDNETKLKKHFFKPPKKKVS